MIIRKVHEAYITKLAELDSNGPIIPYAELIVMSATETCFNKPRFSAACMLVSYLFSRSIGTCQYIAVVSFAENGRFSGPAKVGF